MKTALWKDFFREIKLSLGRFFAIFAIVLLGVAFFAGVKASVPVMKHSADHYYDTTHFFDFQVRSTWGITPSEVDVIRTISGIQDVDPIHTMDALASIAGREQVVKILGLNSNFEETVNRSTVVEGRLPKTSGECALEASSRYQEEVHLGDLLQLDSGTNQPIEEALKIQACTVVGFVDNPLYLSFQKGTSHIGSGSIDSFLLVLEEDFVSEYYTEVNITFVGSSSYNSYDSSYFEFLEPYRQKLLTVMKQEQSNRYQETKQQLEQLLNEHTTKYQYAVANGLPSETMEGTLEQLKNQVQTLEEPQIYVLDRKTNYSYVDYESAADRMDAIARIFPLFFLSVAALVCLTTMTRMVEEERSIIGTYKALGYSKMMIAMKYVFYAFLASLCGGLVGAIVGSILFPTLIYNVWNIMYALPKVQLQFQVGLMLVSTLVVVGITTLAAIGSVYRATTEVPAALMRPKAPKVGKKILLERISFLWDHLSFLKKVTARNLFRYKKRFLMTMIGIAGCTALLVAGFGIRDSVASIVPKQFGEIFKYDALIRYEEGKESRAFDALQKEATLEETLQVGEFTIELNHQLTATCIVPENRSTFSDFFGLHTRVQKKEQTLSTQGVIITEKLAKEQRLNVGDSMSFSLQGISITVKVEGIVEHYVGHYLYMSKELYEQVIGTPLQPTTLLVKLSDTTDETKLGTQLLNLDGVKSVTFYTGMAESFRQMIASLSMVTVVLLISAGLLAFIVLYNLTNVNISERIREIATIKVLGFYDREVNAYVFRENILLTVLGALFGLGLGIILHHFIMGVAELDTIMFGRTILLSSYLLSFLITLLFTFFVNWVMRKKLKEISMVESLKGVE